MKGGTRVSTLGQVGGRGPWHPQVSGARAGLLGVARLPHSDLGGFCSVVRSLRCTHAYAPRHTRLPTHTCTHADTRGHWTQRSLGARGRMSWGLQGSVGQMLARGLCLAPPPPPIPPTPGSPAQSGQGKGPLLPAGAEECWGL